MAKGKKKTTSIYDLWLAAFKHHLDNGPRGIKVKVSNDLGVSAPHLSCLVTDNPKRQRIAGQEFQERAAEYFGYTLLEFLNYGDHVLKGKTFFANSFDSLPEHSRERGALITEKAVKESGLGEVSFLTFDTMEYGGVEPCKQYLAGDLDDEEFYSEIQSVLSEIVDSAKNQ